jgi:hypothetical protein
MKRDILVFPAFLLLSLLFFNLILNNGFWHDFDFITLQNSLEMRGNLSFSFNSEYPFKFQPLVYFIHYLLFNLFHFNPKGYFLFNIILHSINSFLVYMLVNTLLRDRKVALLSGLLFVFTVGNYGKAVMIASGFEDLIITTLTLLTMLFYFKNELENDGKIMSFWFFLSLVFFVASMFTKTTSFSILGCFLAFNFFFRGKERANKPFLNSGFIILFVIAVAAIITKTLFFHYAPHLYSENPGVFRFFYYAGKNFVNYLVRMIFPIHTSHLVSASGSAIVLIYRLATEIRILIILTVFSYSFFGFIFGNRTIRFFITWTYIMVLPFAFFQFPSDWLNIRHLYLVSIGFVVLISSGAIYCSRLVSHRKWRRFIPLIVPLGFIIMAGFIVFQLDKSYENKATLPDAVERRVSLAKKFPDVIVKNGKLHFKE